MSERFYDRWVLNWNLQAVLSGWKKEPDSYEAMEKMQQIITSAMRDRSVSLMVNKRVFENPDIKEAFLTKGTASAYGREEGNLFIFDSSKIKPRVTEIAGKGYVFLERNGQRIGFFRPEYLMGIRVDK